MEHQDWLGSIIAHCIRFHPFDDFTDISGITNPNLASDSPWLTQPWGADHSISLPNKKCCKILLKLRLFLNKPCISWKDCVSLHGSLQHISFIYHDAQNSLPALSVFLLKFLNDYVLHYAPCAVTNDLMLRLTCLTSPTMTHSLLLRQCLDLNLHVNASCHLVSALPWIMAMLVGIYLMAGWLADMT